MIADIPSDDRGLTLGVGLFETILIVDGAPRFWEAHVARLHRGCDTLGLPRPADATLQEVAHRALKNARTMQGRASLRLTWTGGSGARGLTAPAHSQPRLFAQATRIVEPPTGLALATASIRRNPSSPTSRLKTLSYLDNVIARQEAVAAGADEALFLDTLGRLSCVAAGNLFWLERDRLCTPARSCGVLAGVVRHEVLSAARNWDLIPIEVEAEPDRLASSEGAFVTNSLIGAVSIKSVDGSPVRAPASHVLERLSALGC